MNQRKLPTNSKRHKGKPAGFQMRLPLRTTRLGRTGSGLYISDKGVVVSP